MKRTLSLVLALVMVLGTFSATFAAEATVEEKAGEILKALEVMTGDNAGLRLKDGLKREEAVVMIARLKGQLEEAQKFPTKPTYKDITNKAYESLLAWAQEDGTFVGHNEAKFGFGDNITAQEYASVLLRILGYEVGVEKEITWNDVMTKAEKLGLLKNIDADADFLRGNMAVMTLNALRTEMKDSKETLAEKLELDVPAEEVELSTDIEITAAKAISNNKVEVKVKEEVKASIADFTIVKKGTTTELEIKDFVEESAKVFVLETEALTAGTSYTVKSNGKAINFAGIAVDKTAPTAKVTGHDTNRFKVEFTDLMDKATAENVENYSFNRDLKVVSATLKSDRKTVILETDSAKKNTTYKLTIENVLNSDGVAMKKANFNVRAIEYTTAPTIKGTPSVKSSTLIELTFNPGTFGMNKESLEAVENYVIDGLEVTEAKAYDLNSDDLYETVLLTTGEQESNKAYKLTVAGVTDDSVLKNVIKTKTFSVRGMRADKTAPSATKVEAYNGNEVEVTFNDTSAMDIASMTDISNYKITYRDGGETIELTILEAEAWAEGYPRAYDTAKGKALRGVTLTTEEQEVKPTYTIEISNVEDEYGNAMKSTRKLTFKGSQEDLTPPTVKSVKHTDKGVVILFNERLNKDIAVDPTNYVINGDVGSAIKATVSTTDNTNDTVTLVTGSLTANKTYKVTIENIEDVYSNVMPSRGVSFVATASSLDTTAPSFSYAYAENSKEVHINFDEAIDVPANTIALTYGDKNTAGPTLYYSGTINDGTTVVYKLINKDVLDNQTYKLGTAEFKDAAGNKVNIAGETFTGIAGASNAAPTVEYVEQIDPRTVVVYFNEPVELKAADWKAPAAAKDYPEAIDISELDSHGTEWKVRFNSGLKYDTKQNLQFTAIDLGGETLVYTEAKPYEFTADYYDDVAPSIVDVVAVNEKTVEITYDEELSYAGAYKVVTEDDKPVNIAKTSSNKEVVTLTFGTELKADYLYKLTVTAGAKDLATPANTGDTGEWGDFVGSNVKATERYIGGVALINANTIKVTANFDLELAGATVSEGVYNVSDAVYNRYNSNKTVATITTKLPLLANTDYTVKADGKEYKFKGLIEDLGIKFEAVEKDNVVVGYSVAYDGKGSENYDIQVLKLDGGEFTEKVTVLEGKELKTYYAPTVVDADRYIVLKDVNTGSVLYAVKVPVVVVTE